MPVKMRFGTTCLMEDGADVQALKAGSTKVTRATFLKHVDRLDMQRMEAALGYRVHRGSTRSWNACKLFMSKDPHVSYHKGTFRGHPCYYFVWSGIEHIFIEGGRGA